MRKYVLLGVLAILLVAIPAAVAAQPPIASGDICNLAENYVFPSDTNLAFGSIAVGATGHAAGYMTITTCAHTLWHVTMQDGYCDGAGKPGYMYTDDYSPTNRWLTDALQINNYAGGATDLILSCSPTAPHPGTGPVTVWNVGGTGTHSVLMNIYQTAEQTDFGGHYELPIVFTFVADN